MDDDKDDKSFIEKTIEHVKDIASSVTEAVETATTVAKEALEPEPIKLPGDQVAFVSSTPMAEPTMPPFVVIPRHTNAPPKPPAKGSRAKKSSKRTVKKSKAKKAVKKTAPKKSKKAAKKTAKKSPKKKSKNRNAKG